MRRTTFVLLFAALLAFSAVSVLRAQAKTVEGSDNETAREFKPRSGSEKFQFQAEVTRLMDIIINSLYSNKDIFLRELISNASDALDKIRFLALTDKSQLGEGETANLDIRISLDKDNKILKIRDRGIGMTKEDLIKNLGTIAKSGTSAFLEQMQKGGDINLIGQFGVGFYSVYLVSDYVEVVSKHNDDQQWIWESKADGAFAMSEDKDGEVSGEGDLGRGTLIKLHLKDECQEYLQEAKLKELVGKYSEFINFPIYLWSSKEVSKEASTPAASDDDDEDIADVSEDEDIEDVEDEAVEDDDESSESEKAVEKETVWEWDLLNSQKAVWLRAPADISDEEYENFYKALAKSDYEKPVAWTHLRAEGDVEFKSMLFIPERAAWDFYDNYYSRKPQLKLYVRRVFISDDFEDLLPRYLSFLVGLVDSDTLPLNVSREMLQQHASLRTIKKKLVKKALELLRKLSDSEQKHRRQQRGEKDDDDSTSDNEDNATDLKSNAEKYQKVWTQFGKALKLGIIEDNSNRGRLARLLRFQTSKSGDELVSLDDYVSRMKDDQKNIYYLCGSSYDEVSKSPFVEKLVSQGYEVIFFTDSVDEYMMQNLLDHDDKKFQNVSKEDLKIGDEKEKKKVKAMFKPLTTWWKDVIANADVADAKSLDGVRISNRLEKTPCVVVTSKYGWSANMQRIMSAQALGDPAKQAYMRGKQWLEINPRHPLIEELRARVESDPDDASTKQVAQLLYETALMESGFVLEDTKPFASRVYDLVKNTMGLQRELHDIHPETVDDASDDVTADSSAANDDVADFNDEL